MSLIWRHHVPMCYPSQIGWNDVVRDPGSGTPYDVGAYHPVVIVGENGDDADCDDAILEFGWRTLKPP
ncbi:MULTISPECIES: hypothetical protein [unclassified Streptomyces]|uniref:hypothetical protein n=1 Tax=unclassified Streptomyces TaxID=2593676 RepID=UPI00166042C7|nr:MULTISPECIES: hypothetical protein [unclassified Streptomyces]